MNLAAKTKTTPAHSKKCCKSKKPSEIIKFNVSAYRKNIKISKQK